MVRLQDLARMLKKKQTSCAQANWMEDQKGGYRVAAHWFAILFVPIIMGVFEQLVAVVSLFCVCNRQLPVEL